MSVDLGGTPPTKAELYGKLIDSINEFNTGGVPDAEVSVDRVTECISAQVMALGQVIATLCYTQGLEKSDMTLRVLAMMPMIDKICNQVYDDVVEKDMQELFPDVKKKEKR